MFDCLSLLAKRAPRPAGDGAQDFRKLDTERGTYIVEWQPGAINALLRQEGLSARDFRAGEPRELQRLIRDLLLLGLQDEFETCRRSPITRLARALMRRKQHLGASPPAAQAPLADERSVAPI